MNIYYLNAGLHDWENLRSIVVIAENEESARELVYPECGKEDMEPWSTAKCEIIGKAVDGETTRIVCADYYEG